MKTFQKGIWEGDLGGGTQAAKVKTFFKSLLRKLRHFRRASGREIRGEATLSGMGYQDDSRLACLPTLLHVFLRRRRATQAAKVKSSFKSLSRK